MPAFEFEQSSLVAAGRFLHTTGMLSPVSAYKNPQQMYQRFPGLRQLFVNAIIDNHLNTICKTAIPDTKITFITIQRFQYC